MNTKNNGNVQWLGIKTAGREPGTRRGPILLGLGVFQFFVWMLLYTERLHEISLGHALLYEYFLHACYTQKKSLQEVNI